MKTVFKDGVYSRVSNEVGDFQVKHQGFKFVAKKEWKTNIRDFEKERLKLAEAKKEAEIQSVEAPGSKKPYQKPKKS